MRFCVRQAISRYQPWYGDRAGEPTRSQAPVGSFLEPFVGSDHFDSLELFIYVLIYSFAHSFTVSSFPNPAKKKGESQHIWVQPGIPLSHPCNYSLTHLLISSLTHSLTHSLLFPPDPAKQKESPNTFGCSQGYQRFRQSCYKFVNDKYSWSQAEGLCAAEGGHLASLVDK